MTAHTSMLMTAVFLFCGATEAGAQQSPITPQIPAQIQQQASPQGGITGPGMMGRGMMGEGMTGHGMMHEGMMGRGMMGRGMMGPMMSPVAMRMIFALMDGDGDGTVSLQEFQTAHERIFKAMDANKDGVLTLEEIQSFMRGTNRPAQQPSNPPTPQ
jgi:EF hand